MERFIRVGAGFVRWSCAFVRWHLKQQELHRESGWDVPPLFQQMLKDVRSAGFAKGVEQRDPAVAAFVEEQFRAGV